MINIEKFAGLVTNASPYAIPPGAAVTQVNVQCISPGQLSVRPGMQAYTLSSTVSATQPVVASFSFQHGGGSIVVYQDSFGRVFSSRASAVDGSPSLTGVPSAPRSLTATAGSGSVSLDWLEPEFAGGGGGVTGYNVQSSIDGGTTWAFSMSTADSLATVSGLTNGQAYVFRVAATNNYGISAYGTASASVTPVGVPGSPTNLLVAAANSGAALTWTAPANNGGSAITDYVVQFSANAGQAWTTFADGTSTLASANVSGLTNGQPYVFRVAARNAIGTSEYVAYMTATYPVGVPDQVGSLVATHGNAQVSLTWQAPSANDPGGLTDYLIQRSIDSGDTWTTLTDGANLDTTYVVTQLTNGTPYAFRVAATNAIGTGPYSSSTGNVIPRTVAGAPTALTATPGNAQIALSWTAPASNGGATITDYRIQVSANGGAYTTITRAASTTTSYTAASLTNGTAYVYRVSAVNSEGVGTHVQSSSATPQTVPLAPTNVLTTTNNTYVTVRWTAPSDSGGSVITDYIVQYSSDSGSSWLTFADGTSTTLQTNVTGLTNGTAYIFRIAAVSAVGTGNYSTNSASTTPVGPPGTPTSPLVSGGNTQMFASWTAPASDGGSAITGYVIQYRRTSTNTYTTYGTVGNVLEYTISGLTNGLIYVFRVAAVNAVGTGSYSADSASVTVGQVPAAVATPTITNAFATTATDTTLTLSWTAPNSYGSRITDYLIQYGTSTSGPWTLHSDGTGTGTTATITGLNATTTYYYRVSAVSTVGAGPYTATPALKRIAIAPSITSAVTATEADGTVILSWSGESNGGAAITAAYVWYGYNAGIGFQGNRTDQQVPNALLDLTARTIKVPACAASFIQQIRWNVALINLAGDGTSVVSNALSTPFDTSAVGPHTVGSTDTLEGNVALTVNLPVQGCPVVSRIDGEYSVDSGATWTAIPNRSTSIAAYPTSPSAVTWDPYYPGRLRYWISPPPASPFSVRTRLVNSSNAPLNDWVTTNAITVGSDTDPYASRVCFLWDGATGKLVTRASTGVLTTSTLTHSSTASTADRFGRSWKFGYVPFEYSLTGSAAAPSDISEYSFACVEWWMLIPADGVNDSLVTNVPVVTFTSGGTTYTSSVFSAAIVNGALRYSRYSSNSSTSISSVRTVDVSSIRGQWAHIAAEFKGSGGSGTYTVFVNGAAATGTAGGDAIIGSQGFNTARVPSLRVTGEGRYWVPFQSPNCPFPVPT